MSKLSHLERRVLRYHGQPAATVALAERLTVEEVLEVRLSLRSRGHVPTFGGIETESEQQLSLEQVDRLMRTNSAPRPEPRP